MGSRPVRVQTFTLANNIRAKVALRAVTHAPAASKRASTVGVAAATCAANEARRRGESQIRIAKWHLPRALRYPAGKY